MAKKALLHICCGICSSYPVDKLKSDGFQVFGYFYNPNIWPEEEYARRLGVASQVAALLQFDLIIGPYDRNNWLKTVRGLENEPEGGIRCAVCFKMRLEATFNKAKESGFDYFASTLSVSPHKDASLINNLGKSISPCSFLEYDFKKNDGFKKTMDFAKLKVLYRQNYCGCIFSRDKIS